LRESDAKDGGFLESNAGVCGPFRSNEIFVSKKRKKATDSLHTKQNDFCAQISLSGLLGGIAFLERQVVASSKQICYIDNLNKIDILTYFVIVNDGQYFVVHGKMTKNCLSRKLFPLPYRKTNATFACEIPATVFHCH